VSHESASRFPFLGPQGSPSIGDISGKIFDSNRHGNNGKCPLRSLFTVSRPLFTLFRLSPLSSGKKSGWESNRGFGSTRRFSAKVWHSCSVCQTVRLIVGTPKKKTTRIRNY